MSRYYVGLDVHKASICIAFLDAAGKLVMGSAIETGAATVLNFLNGLRGQVEVVFEEGTHAAWLYDILQRTKATVTVCDPLKSRYGELLARGLRPELARVTVARKIATVTPAVRKAGASFDTGAVMKQAA